MDYQTAVDMVIRPRSLAFLGRIADSLKVLGIATTDISVGEADSIDLRFELVALGLLGRQFTCVIELTDTMRLGGPTNGLGALTLQSSDALMIIALSSYSAGEPVEYATDAGVESLVAKLDEIDAAETEVVAKARIALGV